MFPGFASALMIKASPTILGLSFPPGRLVRADFLACSHRGPAM